MFAFLTSLSFLYLFSAILIIGYGFLYYRSFIRNGRQRKGFPWVILLITAACFFFLWFSFHAPLRSGSISNLDHHFIRHDGFRVNGNVLLGRTDTAGQRTKAYNHFRISKANGSFQLASDYAEEPFYARENGSSKLLSPAWDAIGHSFSFQADSQSVILQIKSEKEFFLRINNQPAGYAIKAIKRGSSVWEIFRNDSVLIASGFASNEKIAGGLKQLYLLRDGFSDEQDGGLRFFVSGGLFRFASNAAVDQKIISIDQLGYAARINDGNLIGWGLGFPEKGKNQYLIQNAGADSFRLQNRYPVSYPLTEEPTNAADHHGSYPVLKFLVAASTDIGSLPAVFNEGYLFPAFPGDSTTGFNPVLLSYQKEKAGQPVSLQWSMAGEGRKPFSAAKKNLFLPAKQSGLTWEFSIIDTYNWKLGSFSIPATQWQWIIFGSLFFYFICVFLTGLISPARQLSWVWQVLSAVVIVLLTTRFFLYWRYKSFPPFEGLDLPSVQQLNSFWNFAIIVIATLLLGLIFGSGLLQFLFGRIVRFIKRAAGKSSERLSMESAYHSQRNISNKLQRGLLEKLAGTRLLFWISWIIVLLGGSAVAYFSHFDASVCRHLAIGLVLIYFIFTWLSTGFSPLLVASGKSWWKVDSSRKMHLLISNPARLLLSLSLLMVFSLVDIGFALVFLNFLLFHESFLLINYSIAGLSAGSRNNAGFLGFAGIIFLLLFAVNLLYGPMLFSVLLELPQWLYLLFCFGMALLISYTVGRLLNFTAVKVKIISGSLLLVLFLVAAFFFPKEKIQEKAAMTRYRVDVLSMPAAAAIEKAYANGDGYEPVIRAAQNQWFINTFIDPQHNPGINQTGFRLLPHAPQNRGARYNAQATDLVTSRFLIAEHGRWPALLYVVLLLLPVSLLASFYKLYPDFTNRINPGYAAVSTGFAILNYLLITALLVILAATGRYIFFGQDLPFGSILSKQSILFPALLIIAVILCFRHLPLQQYSNRKKLLPAAVVLGGLLLLLFFVQPQYNRDKDFGVAGLSTGMETYTASRIQPLWDEVDTAVSSRKWPLYRKDQLFVSNLKQLWEAGELKDAPLILQQQLQQYISSAFSQHLDPNRMLFLDLNSGKPELAINENYFHVEAPPHLQQLWRGSVYGDTAYCNISLYHTGDAQSLQYRLSDREGENRMTTINGWQFRFSNKKEQKGVASLLLLNTSDKKLELVIEGKTMLLQPGDSLAMNNPSHYIIRDPAGSDNWLVKLEPDAWMKNYYVNGSRFYHYPAGADFIWARNFAESIAADNTGKEKMNQHVFISLDAVLTDSLSGMIRQMVNEDTARKTGAEYAISIADGNGRIWAIPDYIKGMDRPDPNDKAALRQALSSENGSLSASQLRKRIGNINLMRLNPGPGSTLKPIVFASIASRLGLDWNAFASEGFTEKQEYYGGEKVAPYDFEKNNGRISTVSDYIRYSDNYYHSNLLLLGSYTKQELPSLLLQQFTRERPAAALHWPWFSYKGQDYWLDGFEHWPGYQSGKANFGSDSSFVSTGLQSNFGIHTDRAGRGYDHFQTAYDSALFGRGFQRSGFVLPEYALFDQKGTGMHANKPNEVFMASFRGHVKGSSQVMIPPVKMLDAFGKLVSQNRQFQLTLNPFAGEQAFTGFEMDGGVRYNEYQQLMKEGIFTGMRDALYRGTAAKLGGMLKDGSPYFYYAKTGTTGDDEKKTKSKLFTIIISQKDLTAKAFNFRKNRFVVIYFTSQNGPADQKESFQAAVIKMLEQSAVFQRYMSGK
ncbi:MAG: hypothetical protein IPP99_11670 [Chitinophagaceae bacterium]|nr:hypothetical protein [Chitinophagaceae bacterium]